MGRDLSEAVTAAVDMPNQDLSISPGSRGEVSMSRVTERPTAQQLHALQTASDGIYLTDARASELWTALSELAKRFELESDRESVGARPYLVQLSMVPERR